MEYYINSKPDESGCYGAPVSVAAFGMYQLPEALLPGYLAAKGFVTLTVKNTVVERVVPNTEALAAYEAEHPEPAPTPTLEERVTALEQGGVTPGESDLPERVEALEQAVQNMPGDDSELSGRVDDLEDAVSGLTETVNNLPTGGGAGDASAVWDELAAAYKEGVQSA